MNKKDDGMSFIKIMLAVGILGLILAGGTFAIVFSIMTGNTEVKNPNGDIINEDFTEIDETDLETSIAVIKENTEETLYVLDTIDKKSIEFYLTDQTKYQKRKNEYTVRTEFKVGDVVMLKYSQETLEVRLVKPYNSILERENVEVEDMKREEKQIKIGYNYHNYTDNTLFIYDDEEISPEEIIKGDIITTKGLNNELYSVIVEKSHGFLTLLNREDFIDGEIELLPEDIKNRKYIKVSQAENIPVLEGTYKLILEKDGMQTFVKENVKVEKGEEVTVDLGEIEEMESELIVNVNQDNYNLELVNKNNKEDYYTINENGTYKVKYGEYRVLATSKGYVDWTKDIKISNEKQVLPINFTKAVELKDIKVVTAPRSADVYIDDNYIGATPIEAEVEVGTRKITIRKKGYATLNKIIEVTENNERFSYILHESVNTDEENDDIPVEDLYEE